MQRLKRDGQRNRHTVRIGYNPLGCSGDQFPIDLGHHQRAIRVHPPCGRIIHNIGPGSSSHRADLLAHGGRCRTQDDLHTGERFRANRLDRVFLSRECQAFPDRFLRGEKFDRTHGKLSFGKDLANQITHGTGCTDHRHVHGHGNLLSKAVGIRMTHCIESETGSRGSAPPAFCQVGSGFTLSPVSPAILGEQGQDGRATKQASLAYA
jgi:hypothetical protein